MKLSDSLLDNDSISHNKVTRIAELHFIFGQEVFQRLISDVAYKKCDTGLYSNTKHNL